MNGMGQRIAHPEGGAESIAAHAQVRDLAEKFEGMPLLLQRVSRRIGRTIDLNRRDFKLHRLPLCGGLNQLTDCLDAAPGGDLFERLIADRSGFHYELHAFEARTVVQLDEGNAFGVTARPNPTAQYNFALHRSFGSLLDCRKLWGYMEPVSA